MEKSKAKQILRSILLGNRYSQLDTINDQVRYMTMNGIFMAALIPLVLLGFTNIHDSFIRAMVNFSIALLCFICLILMRSKIRLHIIPIFPVSFFGAYHLYLIYAGILNFWAALGILTFPLIVIFLCKMTVGLIESIIVLIGMILFMFTPIALVKAAPEISMRYILAYVFTLSLTIMYERISIHKDRKEKTLKAELAQERDIIKIMKDNSHQGIFLLDAEYRILPQYSKPLISILSYYDSELAGRNFLDILNSSLNSKQLQILQGYFAMVFSKTKSEKIIEAANPITEFEYKIDDRVKTLSTRFQLVEQANSESMIIGIIQDISREKEFENELQTQKEAQELEMKNLFDVLQIDPIVFQDFIDDTEANFNYINSTLKDRTLTAKQVVEKFYQNVHAIKSNALILGLETFGKKLHTLEDDIKTISALDEIKIEDVFDLMVKLETIMQDKDNYMTIVKKISSFQSNNQIDSILVNSVTKAVEKISAETQKKVEFKAEQLDKNILESSLRKPIRDILFQCVRNSIYHGIEPNEERIRKNKKPLGLLTFSVKMVDGKAEVLFSDDGRGLDWEKIKKKYIELHPDAKEVSNAKLLACIFSPEFSTADAVSTHAGRGVGLSLVKDIVKENNGTVKVQSSDEGLTFRFTFPIPA